MTRGTRLELTWVGKYDQPRLEPRILLEDPAKSYCAKERVSASDRFDNLLIHGDNLLALKALEHDYAGKVKCVCIDPPYNTGSAFAHYDDGMEHSLWLTMMRDRMVLLRNLLSEDGSIWVAVDDNEGHYLKVLMDEVFGRSNFVATVIWQKLHARNNSAQNLSADHDFILTFARDIEKWKRNKVGRTEASDADFWNPDNDSRGLWRRSDLTAAKPYKDGHYEVTGPNGDKFSPRANRYWSLARETFDELEADNRIWWGKTGSTFPFRKRFKSELGELVPTTVWSHEEVGNNREAKQEITQIYGREDIFSTPKPERLIHRVLHIATNPGDLVLDSFAGSGTTGAVAHKMGRRWIMVELGDHCDTHVVPRLQKVIDGADPGGVTEATGWKGGGGFRYYDLAPSLLEKGARGPWIISPKYNEAMLAEAVCKHEGFEYNRAKTVYWQDGQRRDSPATYLWVTTQTLTRERLERLSTEVGEGVHLMVMCLAFKGDPTAFANLVVKKLPSSILDRCEWGKDDYSLKIAALGAAPADDAAPHEEKKTAAKAKRSKGAAPESQGDLFAGAKKGEGQ